MLVSQGLEKAIEETGQGICRLELEPCTMLPIPTLDGVLITQMNEFAKRLLMVHLRFVHLRAGE